MWWTITNRCTDVRGWSRSCLMIFILNYFLRWLQIPSTGYIIIIKVLIRLFYVVLSMATVSGRQHQSPPTITVQRATGSTANKRIKTFPLPTMASTVSTRCIARCRFWQSGPPAQFCFSLQTILGKVQTYVTRGVFAVGL